MNHYTGGEYLQIDIASQFGLDKEQFEDRLQWTDQNEYWLEAKMGQADDPFRYMAAVMAYRDAQNGVPTGHMVGMDACASGLGIMACLTGCKTTARNVGLTGKQRMDMYTICTAEMSKLLGVAVEVIRNDVKYAQMTHFYGSKAKPKELFVEGTKEYRAFFEAQKIVAPGPVELLPMMIYSWRPFALSHSWTLMDGFECICPVMVHDDVPIEVDELDHATFTYRHRINCGTEKGLELAAHITHGCDGFVVRELTRRCNYDTAQLIIAETIIQNTLEQREHGWNASALFETPRIEQLATMYQYWSLVGIEYIDAKSVIMFGTEYLERLLDLILRTLSYRPFQIVSIHDEYKAHANNCNRLRLNYMDVMAELAESTALQAILTQISGRERTINKYSEDLGDLIRQGEYGIS